MSDLEKYIDQKKAQSSEFKANFENGYKEFKAEIPKENCKKA